MAVGNTFGATALTSYGGFWIGTAIILTPGGFEIIDTLGGAEATAAPAFYNSFGLYLMVRQSNFSTWISMLIHHLQGWFIFTFILLICTLRSTVAFFLLFFFLDLAFLCLGLGYLYAGNAALIKAGGVFGILAAFAAWYNALAGIADTSNSFFLIPVAHFPWSDKGRQIRRESIVDNSEARAAQGV